jgi:hypothetical protein
VREQVQRPFDPSFKQGKDPLKTFKKVTIPKIDSTIVDLDAAIAKARELAAIESRSRKREESRCGCG